MKSQRRLGVMGGTFDPIHNGHLVAANEVTNLFHLDEVVFMPAYQTWQKYNNQVSTAEDRYLMTVIATASNPRFSVSRIDINRGGITYTIDTLSEIHELDICSDPYFIAGADILQSILSWKNIEDVLGKIKFIGVSRPGYNLNNEHIKSTLCKYPSDTLTLVEITALEISSSDCRKRASENRPIWYLVPDGVVDYISKRRLYNI